ncbi:hypothetical protein KKC_06132, partial [Listeria fleischmannii subsp. coloradonensis]
GGAGKKKKKKKKKKKTGKSNRLNASLFFLSFTGKSC